MQGKIQGFGSGSSGPDSRDMYSGIGSSGSSSGAYRPGAPASMPSFSQLGSQLGDGIIAQGLASAASAVNDLLGKGQYGNRLTVRIQGYEVHFIRGHAANGETWSWGLMQWLCRVGGSSAGIWRFWLWFWCLQQALSCALSRLSRCQ